VSLIYATPSITLASIAPAPAPGSESRMTPSEPREPELRVTIGRRSDAEGLHVEAHGTVAIVAAVVTVVVVLMNGRKLWRAGRAAVRRWRRRGRTGDGARGRAANRELDDSAAARDGALERKRRPAAADRDGALERKRRPAAAE
jgi:hypothetical protein